MIDVLPVSVKPADTAAKPQSAVQKAAPPHSSVKMDEIGGEEGFFAQLERFIERADREQAGAKDGAQAYAAKRRKGSLVTRKKASYRFMADPSVKKASASGRLVKPVKAEQAGIQGKNIVKQKQGKILNLLRLGSHRGRFTRVSMGTVFKEVQSKRPVKADTRNRGEGLQEADKRKRVKKGVRTVKLIKRAKQASPGTGTVKNISVNEKPGPDDSVRPRTWHNMKENSFACERYESNLHRAETVQDLRVHSSAAKSSDEIFGEFVRQFTFVVKKGGGEAQVVLQPESLGKMKLNIKLNNAEVNTSMIVETNALKDLIVSKLATLQEGLLSQGFSLGSFNVEVKAGNESHDMAGQEKSSGKTVVKESGIEEAEAGLEVRSPGLPWISTVVNITV